MLDKRAPAEFSPKRGLFVGKEIPKTVQVFVRDNNVDGALKALKKKMQREGVFKEMKMRSYFEKPSQKKLREKAENIRRSRKMARRKIYS